MSEGINFSDDLARCVILVGLPYPNPHDPVLKVPRTLLSQHASSKSSFFCLACFAKKEKVRYQDSLSSSKGSAGKV